MGRSQLKKGLKHSLHEDAVGITQGPEGDIYSSKVHKRITPKHDCSINRENPNRKMPSNPALVVGYDGSGNFDRVVPHGATHGYWTLANVIPMFCPFDGAGASGNYIARSLLEFDLDDAGITAGDLIESATLRLTYYKSKTIRQDSEFAFDLHRVHPGLTGNTGGNASATAVDAIDTSGYTTSNADASFTIAIPTSAGGLGGTAVTILLDEDKDDGTQATAAANTITIGTFDASENDDMVADFIINAINGVAAGRFIYASEGNGQSGHDLGITAKQGSSQTKITLTMDLGGESGNISDALASASGVNIIDVTDFTGGSIYGHAHSDKMTSNATWWEYDFTNTATGCSPGFVCGVTSGIGTFLVTQGGTHGTKRWEYQGLGYTGSTAEHSNTGIGGATGWVDYSGGPVGSDQDSYSDNLYTGFTASKSGNHSVRANKVLDFDVTEALTDAQTYYNNKLRFMIKLRDDHTFEAGATTEKNRIFVSFHSSEAENGIGPLGISDVSAIKMPTYAPSIHVTYYNRT